MSTTISPAATRVLPNGVTVPVDGDLANAASVATPISDLLTGVDAARKLLYGAKLRPRYSIDIADSTVTPIMKIQPLGSVLVQYSGVWMVIDHSVTTSLNLLTTLGAANFTLKTRYYVYYGFDGTNAIWEITTTAPDNQLKYKSGDTSKAYIGTFLSDAATNTSVVPCYEFGGVHKLTGVRGLQVVSGGAAAVATAFKCFSPAAFGQLTPTYAREIILQASATSSGADHLYIGTKSTLPTFTLMDFISNESHTVEFSACPDDNENMYYLWTTGGAGRGVDIFLAGWRDPR